MRSVGRLTSVVLAPLLEQLRGLGNARWVSVHEVDARQSLGKSVLLGRL
jgi:DMSO/TMAO reductase YedYZ molybdopterin-dependent catalytic subunit